MKPNTLPAETIPSLLLKIRKGIALFIAGLVISGITAFPIQWELNMLVSITQFFGVNNDLSHWIEKVNAGVAITAAHFPFMAYGTDWLAFAHLVIAIAFVGPLRDPVRNKWVIEFGLLACFAIFPLAMLAGAVRDIPWFWRGIDCSFGVAGGWVLLICLKRIYRLEKLMAP